MGAEKPVESCALKTQTTRGSTRVLSFLDGGVSDYNAPVLFAATPEWEPQEARELLSDILSALPAFDVIELEKMPAAVLARSNPLLHLGAERWPCEGHAASTAQTWEAFSASRIKHSKRFERYHRQLARSAPLSYVIAEAGGWQGAFKALLAQKEARFAETRVPGFSEQPGMIEFYREMTRRHLGSGLVHLSAVASGERTIAAQWGLRQEERYYYLICGYEAGEWEKYSPGRLVTEAMLKWCHDSGLAVADFGIGDEPYKYEYCDRHLPLYSTVKPVSLLGWIYATRLRGLAWLRSRPLWQALRPYKWIALRALRRSPPERGQE